LKSRTRRGFTLVEILLVVLILVMLAGVAIVAVGNTRERARIDLTGVKLKAIGRALDTYNLHMQRYPSEQDGGLKALLVKPAEEGEGTSASAWAGPYLEENPKDAWDHDFHYEVQDTSAGATGGPAFKLWSDGPDGQSGTADDIKNYKDESAT